MNPKQQVLHKIVLDPATVKEVILEPNSCFKVVGVDYDGSHYVYKGSKGKLWLEQGGAK